MHTNHQNITGITNNNNNMLQTIESNLQKSMPLAPLMDVPSWAVPARGESRLEVSLILVLLHSLDAILQSLSQFLTFPICSFSTAGLRFSWKTVSR
jgi:hypothetical protein